MRRRFRQLAIALVRSWTRAYTTGMHAELRRRRCAEVESDIWEALHDQEYTSGSGFHIMARFAQGIPADVLWRLEHGAAGGQRMWKKVVFLGIATAAVIAMLRLFFPGPDLSSLPQLPAKPIPNYVEKRRVPPPPPPPPTWEEFVAKVNGREPLKSGTIPAR
jgi:hypothetical protein